MFERIETLKTALTNAGFRLGEASRIPQPSTFELLFQGAEPTTEAKDGGHSGAAQVSALIAAKKRLRDAGLTFLADRLKAGVVFLTVENPNYVMSTAKEGVSLNVAASPGIVEDLPLDGAPWGRVEGIEAFKAGTPQAEIEAATLEIAAVHEAGHVLDFAASEGVPGMVMAQELEKVIKTPKEARAISRYAAESRSSEEASAEAFSKAVYGRPLPKALDSWKARVMRYAAHGGTF